MTHPLCTPSEHHALQFINKTERHREPYTEQLLEKFMANRKKSMWALSKVQVSNWSFSFYLDTVQYDSLKLDGKLSTIVRVIPCSQAHFTGPSTWENIWTVMQPEHSQILIYKPQMGRVRLGLHEKRREKWRWEEKRKWDVEGSESTYVNDAHYFLFEPRELWVKGRKRTSTQVVK